MGCQIVYSHKAESDIDELFYVIITSYKAPLTAGRYVQGIYNAIRQLETIASSLPVQTSPFFLHYGSNVRRINYKKTAIIYTVHNGTVYIHRIIPASLITDL